MYVGNSKTNASYNYFYASCRNVTVEPTSSTNSSPTHKLGGVFTTAFSKLTKSYTASRTATDLQGVITIYLPKIVLALLNNPPSQLVIHYQGYAQNWTSLLIMDTGATNHMLPDNAAFVSYYPVSGWQVRMGNNFFAPILGHVTAVISLNGKKILIHECFHVLELLCPLYSLWAHQQQRSWGFIEMYGLGMHVFFPSFIMEVNTAMDCHLYYKPIGWACCLADLDYFQPNYVTDQSASATATTPVKCPAAIRPDNDLTDLLTFAPHWPKHPPSPQYQSIAMPILPLSTYTKSLKDLDRDKQIQQLYLVEQSTPAEVNSKQGKSTTPLQCMSQDNILKLLHHPNLTLLPIWPCDTPNLSDTKSHWTMEELHRITGCQCFRNDQHLVASTEDGAFIDNIEFPASIRAYMTIPKAPRSKPIDCTTSKYLDIIHIFIAFGDCMSVSGFKYALIFVVRATQYNFVLALNCFTMTISLQPS